MYLRDVDKREVDFLVTVEVKRSDTALSPALLYYRGRLPIPYVFQVVKKDKIEKLEKGARIISGGKFLAGLI